MMKTLMMKFDMILILMFQILSATELTSGRRPLSASIAWKTKIEQDKKTTYVQQHRKSPPRFFYKNYPDSWKSSFVVKNSRSRRVYVYTRASIIRHRFHEKLCGSLSNHQSGCLRRFARYFITYVRRYERRA